VINPYGSKACQAALSLDDKLHGIVEKRLKKIDRKHHDKLRESAGYLVLKSEYSREFLPVQKMRRRNNRDAEINRSAADQLRQLQEAGIIPVPSWWMIALQMFIKFVVLPFLRDVLLDYTSEEDEL
jgi:hypothetical protein